MIRDKRLLRRKWKRTRTLLNKTILNRANKELKRKIKLREYKNDQLSNYLKKIGYNQNSERKLWHATKYLKRPSKKKVPRYKWYLV